jgi:hypothetical protein
MFRYLRSLFAARPPVELRHAEFGVLTLDSGLWWGAAQSGERSIRFCIDGTDAEPDVGLLDRVRDLLTRFAEVERSALDLLRSHAAYVGQGEFAFDSLDFLWADKPHLFTLEFTLAGDDEAIWRVEFENGQPKYVGRDD